MAAKTNEKRYALEWIDEHARRFSDFHLRIWNYAEPAWREYKSAKAYCDLLRAEGFCRRRSGLWRDADGSRPPPSAQAPATRSDPISVSPPRFTLKGAVHHRGT
jgi:hypothetical protein